MISIECSRKKRKRFTEVENYVEACNSPEKYVLHHRREVQNGVQIWTVDELKAIGQYDDVSPDELIYMKLSDHIKLHLNAFDPKRKCLCKYLTAEQKLKISEARKGQVPWNKGTNGKQKWTVEQREKFNEYTSSLDFKNRYTKERNEKISNARKKLKREYLPDGTYRMVSK